MIHLKNNCRYSGIKVTPKNWETTTSCKKPWFVYYRFYDTAFKVEFPKGKLVPEKGMNSYHTADDRRSYIRGLMASIKEDIEVMDYNPITGYRKPPIENKIGAIDPDLPVIEALEAALKKIRTKKTTVAADPTIIKRVSRNADNIKSVLKYTGLAIRAGQMERIPIKNITRSHMKQVMEYLACIKGKKWTAHCHNSYRSHLMMLFEELVEWEAIQGDPMLKIKTQKVTRKKRLTLTVQERIKIDAHLRKVNFRFWRFVKIFHRSGARETEIMLVKKEDVDLKRQMVMYTILKGVESTREERPITNDVLHLWEQVYIEAVPGQYLFAEGLKPGDKPIRPDQITRRWNFWVKKPLGIDADIYSLKHSNSTETAKKVGTRLAALHNQHSEQILKKNYDMEGVDIEMEILKSIVNDFAPQGVIVTYPQIDLECIINTG